MNAISRRGLVVSLLCGAVLLTGCQSQKKPYPGTPLAKIGVAVNVHTRQDADMPVTRYAYNGEICDVAIGSCQNAGSTNVAFAWHQASQSGALFKLLSGTVVVQGTFPPISPVVAFPVPWPIIVTNWVSIGAEGTTFAVYRGNDSGGKPCNYVFLFDGEALKVEVTGAPAPQPGTTFPPGDASHRRLVAAVGKVMYVKVSEPSAGTIFVSEPADVLIDGDASAKSAFTCINELRKKSKLDKPFSDIVVP